MLIDNKYYDMITDKKFAHVRAIPRRSQYT